MTWFRKEEPREAWEIDDEGAIDDIKAARQIREICNSVSGSAERVAVLFYGPNNKSKKREIDRYKRARKLAEKKVEQISDKLLRDTALNQILNFCMKANDIESAEKLFHQLQTTMIKENVISEHPIFRD
jgi:pentatricopeptide repeat protein